MTKNKAAETSAFATSSSGSAAAPAKALSLKTSRSRNATPKAEAPVLSPATNEVAQSLEVPIESTTRTSKLKTPRAKSTAVTHRHKKLETAPVANADLRVEIAPAQAVEPRQEDVAKLAYSYYVARGYQPGNPAEDWFRAVTELRARLNP
jgi:Protein of unknown function (DUF2934)